ncbi:beta-2-glycoprotein 1-like isoform X1 [Thunnus albacares]|uniref:beta-2-glycoprotein 1-like isoform X1 n=1 Tax=Thunnus albacares TaxID=8236 RepID=UPI001CF6D12B|nr:beta-2-glycoprotein 1-like isoform X1 [Thunnus albacares]
MDRALLLLSLWALTGTVSLQASGSCPERLLGEERRRTCPRPCKADKDCGSKRQCLCDGQCGLSCVAPGRTCPWPLPPSESSVARLLSPTHSFSALLEVRCKPGFALPNGLDATIRRCQGDRQWSGDEPICTEYLPVERQAEETQQPEPSAAQTCPLPEEVINTFSIQGDATVGTSIGYSCLSGADIVGSSENFCQENQTWQYPHPICKNVNCQPPREVEQGYVVAVQKTEYEVGFDIHYLCKKNFLLDGPQKVTCLSNGSWSASPPYCRARCLIPAERSRVEIGGVKRWPFDITDAMVPHGENVTFYCKHPRKQCSFTATQTCFDGNLQPPACYLEPTWLQYKLFPHRLVSEIEACEPDDVE